MCLGCRLICWNLFERFPWLPLNLHLKKLGLIELIALIYPKKSLLEVNHGLLLVLFCLSSVSPSLSSSVSSSHPLTGTRRETQNLQQRSTHQRGWFAHAWESFPRGQSLHSFALVTQCLSFSPPNRLPWRTVISKGACRREQNLRFLLTFRTTFYD